jgi:predicted peptidase
MAQTPLWILHGSADTINPVDSSRTIYNSILAAGGTNVRYTEYPGLDHSTIWAQVEAEPGLCDWLLVQRRQ